MRITKVNQIFSLLNHHQLSCTQQPSTDVLMINFHSPYSIAGDKQLRIESSTKTGNDITTEHSHSLDKSYTKDRLWSHTVYRGKEAKANTASLWNKRLRKPNSQEGEFLYDEKSDIDILDLQDFDDSDDSDDSDDNKDRDASGEPQNCPDLLFTSGEALRHQEEANSNTSTDKQLISTANQHLFEKTSDLSLEPIDDVYLTKAEREKMDKIRKEREQRRKKRGEMGKPSKGDGEQRKQRETKRLSRKELKESQRAEQTKRRMKKTKAKERDLKRAKLETRRREQLDTRLKKRVVQLELYLEKAHFSKRIDLDAITLELEEWKLELAKPKEERITLKEFKQKLQRKLNSRSNNQEKDGLVSSEIDLFDNNKEPIGDTFLFEKKRKQLAEFEEQRQLKRAKREASSISKAQKKFQRNHAKEVERRQRRIKVLEKMFSNLRSQYRPKMQQLWDELYHLKQQEQERIIKEYNKNEDGGAQMLLLPVYSPLHQELHNRELDKMRKEIENIQQRLANPRARYDIPALQQRVKRLQSEYEAAVGYHYRNQLEKSTLVNERVHSVLPNTTDASVTVSTQPATEIIVSPEPPPRPTPSNDEKSYRVLTKERPFRRPNINYIKFYNRQVQETLDPGKCIPDLPFSSLKINYDGTYPNEMKYPGQIWSSKDKELFFTLLARYSIHQLDMIGLHMGKSELEILTYYNLLKGELRKLKRCTRSPEQGSEFLTNQDYRLVKYEEIPAAYEMLKYFTKLEDEQSLLIDAEMASDSAFDEGINNDDIVAEDASSFINVARLSYLFGMICDKEVCRVMEDLVKQVTKNILINIINTKTKKKLENGDTDASTVTIHPRNIKWSLSNLGYSNPNKIFNVDNPLIKKAFTRKNDQRRWFGTLHYIVSAPAFGNLVPVPRKQTIPTIHNLHQFQNRLHQSSNEMDLDEEDEEQFKLFQLETKAVDDCDLLELRMYEHALLMMMLDGKTDVSAGDVKRLNRWDRELNLEVKASRKVQSGGKANDREKGDDNDENNHKDDVSDGENIDHEIKDALKAYSRQFPDYNYSNEQQSMTRKAMEEVDEDGLSVSCSGSDDEDNDNSSNDGTNHRGFSMEIDNDGIQSGEDYIDDTADFTGPFDEFFIRNYE